MLLPRLMIKSVRSNPRTGFLHDLSEVELKRRIFDLFQNMGRWLGEKSDAEIEATYGELGRRRCREGVPLSELVYALIMAKQQLWEFVQRNDLPDTATNLYGEEMLHVTAGQFFDKAIYHTVRAYEETWSKEGSLRLLAGVPVAPGMTGTTMNIARAALGALQSRRGLFDNDPGLRSVTLAVTLGSSGKVRSLTVQQESGID
jgi:hypothetical protein